MKRTAYFLIFLFLSCSSKLSYIKAEDIINKYYKALSEKNIKYQVEQAPVKTIKVTYGNKKKAVKYLEEKFPKRNNNNTTKYTNISNLSVSKLKKCFRKKAHIVTYSIRSAQFAPYYNEEYITKKYGEDNFLFRTNTQILEITKSAKKVIIYDSDNKWKIISYDFKNIENGYGGEVADCIINQ